MAFGIRYYHVNDAVPEHLRSTVARIRAAKIAAPPAPWRVTAQAAVGGLEAIGFAPSSDLLLVVSSQGRGVFDCLSRQRVGRDRESDGITDVTSLEAQGIGPLSGQRIRLSGLHGGGLPRVSTDGWSVERFALDWPKETCLLVPPGSWAFGDAFGKPAELTKVYVDSEIRAWGFSPTGKSLVLATSSDVTIFARP
jgi:hypothetical protein